MPVVSVYCAIYRQSMQLISFIQYVFIVYITGIMKLLYTTLGVYGVKKKQFRSPQTTPRESGLLYGKYY